jgi:hypothetical protein
MTNTLNRYNRKRRSKTQRKRRGGLKYKPLSGFQPGQIHNFDRASNNLDALDSMIMNSQIPVLVRHHRKSCPHCEDFEGTWKHIETSANGHPEYSVASLDDWATDHMNKKHYSRHGYSVSGVPTVVMIDRDRVPKEHKGPNTLEALEEFLKKHGMQLKIVPIEPEPASAPASAPALAPASEESMDQPPASKQPLNQPSDQPLNQPLEQPLASPQSDGSFFDTVKDKVGAIDSTIESGVSKVTAALTEPINLTGLFSSNDTKEATVNAFPEAPPANATNSVAAANANATNSVADANANATNSVAAANANANATNSVADANANATNSVAATSSENNQITGAPQVPSIGGRRNRKSKKSKKGKKSKNSSKRRTKRRRSNKK